MEQFFVTDLAAKHRELVCTKSPAPKTNLLGRTLCQELPGAKRAFKSV